VATTANSHDGSPGDPAFALSSTASISFLKRALGHPAANIGAMWAGSAINVEYFIYGALLMGFGFSFYTALSIIILGNLSFFLLGLASLQGPEAGTTTLRSRGAAFGTRGARIISFFNWITRILLEIPLEDDRRDIEYASVRVETLPDMLDT